MKPDVPKVRGESNGKWEAAGGWSRAGEPRATLANLSCALKVEALLLQLQIPIRASPQVGVFQKVMLLASQR